MDRGNDHEAEHASLDATAARVRPAPVEVADNLAAGPSPLAVEYRPAAALIPFAKNARTHSDAQVAQIAASIREFGWTNPILVDGDNGIIAGHGRLLAARKLGMGTVPVIELAGLSRGAEAGLHHCRQQAGAERRLGRRIARHRTRRACQPRLRPVADRLRRSGDRGADRHRQSRPDRSRRHSRGACNSRPPSPAMSGSWTSIG